MPKKYTRKLKKTRKNKKNIYGGSATNIINRKKNEIKFLIKSMNSSRGTYNNFIGVKTKFNRELNKLSLTNNNRGHFNKYTRRFQQKLGKIFPITNSNSESNKEVINPKKILPLLLSNNRSGQIRVTVTFDGVSRTITSIPTLDRVSTSITQSYPGIENSIFPACFGSAKTFADVQTLYNGFSALLTRNSSIVSNYNMGTYSPMFQYNPQNDLWEKSVVGYSSHICLEVSDSKDLETRLFGNVLTRTLNPVTTPDNPRWRQTFTRVFLIMFVRSLKRFYRNNSFYNAGFNSTNLTSPIKILYDMCNVFSNLPNNMNTNFPRIIDHIRTNIFIIPVFIVHTDNLSYFGLKIPKRFSDNTNTIRLLSDNNGNYEAVRLWIMTNILDQAIQQVYLTALAQIQDDFTRYGILCLQDDNNVFLLLNLDNFYNIHNIFILIRNVLFLIGRVNSNTEISTIIGYMGPNEVYLYVYKPLYECAATALCYCMEDNQCLNLCTTEFTNTLIYIDWDGHDMAAGNGRTNYDYIPSRALLSQYFRHLIPQACMSKCLIGGIKYIVIGPNSSRDITGGLSTQTTKVIARADMLYDTFTLNPGMEPSTFYENGVISIRQNNVTYGNKGKDYLLVGFDQDTESCACSISALHSNPEPGTPIPSIEIRKNVVGQPQLTITIEQLLVVTNDTGDILEPLTHMLPNVSISKEVIVKGVVVVDNEGFLENFNCIESNLFKFQSLSDIDEVRSHYLEFIPPGVQLARRQFEILIPTSIKNAIREMVMTNAQVFNTYDTLKTHIKRLPFFKKNMRMDTVFKNYVQSKQDLLEGESYYDEIHRLQDLNFVRLSVELPQGPLPPVPPPVPPVVAMD